MRKQSKKLHAVDLDGTLAYQLHPYNPNKIGPPVLKMVNKIDAWLKAGDKVCIFTARMSVAAHTPLRLKKNRMMIQEWSKMFLGKVLPITAEKHPAITDYWDNNAHRIETDTGKVIKGQGYKVQWQEP